jgi:hypothetical protein
MMWLVSPHRSLRPGLRIVAGGSLPSHSAVLGNDLNMVVALAVLVPELGQISGAQAAALLGVAPYPDDSGTANARSAAGGRMPVAPCIWQP